MPGREIVIELEQVRTVRRSAPVMPLFCKHCEKDQDFVSLAEVERLFETCRTKFVGCFVASGVHVNGPDEEPNAVCVPTLLAYVDRRGSVRGSLTE